MLIIIILIICVPVLLYYAFLYLTHTVYLHLFIDLTGYRNQLAVLALALLHFLLGHNSAADQVRSFGFILLAL